MRTVETSLLLNAATEIEQLRKENQLLAAQVSVVEVFAAALGLRKGLTGMAPDVAWELRRAAEGPSLDSTLG